MRGVQFHIKISSLRLAAHWSRAGRRIRIFNRPSRFGRAVVPPIRLAFRTSEFAAPMQIAALTQ
jgi:hypothetical protein